MRRNRVVLTPVHKGNTQHLTITERRQHLEVHGKDSKTGEQARVLNIDFYWVTTRLSDPSFLDEVRRRWLERSFQVPSARELRSIGAKALMLVPTEAQALLPDSDGVVDAPLFYSVAMRGLRHAAPGTTRAALGAEADCLGLVWTARVSRRQRAVLFTPWSDVVTLMHWFMSELAGPSGYIPFLEEQDVA